jgi:hypothetical protein
MSTLRTNPSRWTWSETLARLAWVALATMHLSPLWRTVSALAAEGPSLRRIGVLAVLVVFLAFFILKACGVGFLRVRCRKMSLVAFLVCCGLVHGEDAAQWAKDPAHQAVAWSAVVAAGATVADRRGLRRKVREALDGLRELARSAAPAPARLAYVARDAGWHGGPAPGRRCGASRGPPSDRF